MKYLFIILLLASFLRAQTPVIHKGQPGQILTFDSNGRIVQSTPTPLGTSGLNNVLNYAPGVNIGGGAVHTVANSGSNTIFSGITTLIGLASISLNGATPFSWITGTMFTGITGKYFLTDADVPNLDIAWLAAQACEISQKCYYPAGTYIVGSVRPLPLYRPLAPESGGRTIGGTAIGDGPGVTFIRPGYDWGAGYGVYYCGDPSASRANGIGRYNPDGECSGILANLTIQSSAANPLFAMGTAPIQMDGLMWGSRMDLDNVTVAGFNHDASLTGDHTHFNRLHAFGGAIGIYWDTPSQYLLGDITFTDLRSEGQSMASMSISPLAIMSGVTGNGETYVSAPIGIRAEGGSCTPAMTGVHFDQFFDEFMGNAAFSDESGLSNGVWTEVNKCRNILKWTIDLWFQNWDNNHLWTSGGRGRRATIDAAQVNIVINTLSGAGAQTAPVAVSSGPAPIATFNVKKTSVDAFSGSQVAGDIDGWIAQSGTLPLVVSQFLASVDEGNMRLISTGKWSGAMFGWINNAGNYTKTTAGDVFETFQYYATPGGRKGQLSTTAGIVMQSGLTSSGGYGTSLVPLATDGIAAIRTGGQGFWFGAIKAGSGIGPKITITSGGTDGTDGSYTWTASGGGCLIPPSGNFTVTGGTVVSSNIMVYGTNCTGVPTISTSASTNLTGSVLTPQWPSAMGVFAASLREKAILGSTTGGNSPGNGNNYMYTLLQFGGGGIDTFADIPQQIITHVSGLVTCNVGTEGKWGAVDDAAANPVYNAVVVSGGVSHIPVYCNGSSWVNR